RFFRDSINREEKLLELSNDIIRQKSPEQLTLSLLRVLEEALHPKKAALYLRSEEGNDFPRMSVEAWLESRMGRETLWSSYFSQDAQPLMQDQSASYAGHPRQDLLEALSVEMKHQQIHAAFPLRSRGQLFGFLFLGEKKSEQPYSKEDLVLLRHALNQTTLA